MLDHEFDDDAAARLLMGFEAGADGGAVRVGRVFVQIGGDPQGFQQIGDSLARGRAGFDDFDPFRIPLGGDDAVGGKLLIDAIDVDAGQIDLIEGDDDRDVGGAGVADGFLGLRHDAVVAGDDQHGDIGDVGAAGAHFGERFVAGRVHKRNPPAVALDLVGANVLSNAAAFAAGDVDADDLIEQRRFAMIDVTEECHDRRAALKFFRIGLRLIEAGQDFVLKRHRVRDLDLDAQLDRQQLGLFGVERRIDREHLPVRNEHLLDLRHRDANGLAECANRAGQFERDFSLADRRGFDAAALDSGQAASGGRAIIVPATAIGRFRAFSLKLACHPAAQQRLIGRFGLEGLSLGAATPAGPGGGVVLDAARLAFESSGRIGGALFLVFP